MIRYDHHEEIFDAVIEDNGTLKGLEQSKKRVTKGSLTEFVSILKRGEDMHLLNFVTN